MNASLARHGRLLIWLLPLAALLMAAPGASAAVTAEVVGKRIVIDGDAERNAITVTARRSATRDTVVIRLHDGVLRSTTCRTIAARRLECVVAGRARRIDIDAGAQADTIRVRGPVPARLDGGAGADRLFGSAAADVIVGGSGNDYLNGRRGDDRIWGGRGMDTLAVSAGRDRFNAGSKRRREDFILVNRFSPLQIGSGRIRANRVDTQFSSVGLVEFRGGSGRDIVDARRSTTMVAAMLGGGPDRFWGSRTGDLVDGGAGDDTIITRRGTDFVFAGAGRDRVRLGPNRDFVVSEDGRRDRLIHCGPGADFALSDEFDTLVGCEDDQGGSGGFAPAPDPDEGGEPVDVIVTRFRAAIARYGSSFELPSDR